MSEIETRPAGRPCLTCASPQRQAIEEALVSGDTISTISTMFRIDRSSLRRHRDRHLAWSPEQAREAGLSAATILVRLSELEERLRETAAEAFEAGNVLAHVRAAEGQRRALQTMALLGGNNAESVAITLNTQKLQLRAVGRVMRAHPAVADRLAVALEQADELVLAREVRTQFLETSSRELT